MIREIHDGDYYPDLPNSEQIVAGLEDGIISILAEPMDVDELERLSNGIQYSQEELSASILDALHAAIKTQFDEIEAYADNIDSESTLSDHKRILQKLGPKIGLGLSMIDDAIKVIDRRIEKIAEDSEEVEAPSFTKAKLGRSDEFSDKDLESLFHSLLTGKS